MDWHFLFRIGGISKWYWWCEANQEKSELFDSNESKKSKTHNMFWHIIFITNHSSFTEVKYIQSFIPFNWTWLKLDILKNFWFQNIACWKEFFFVYSCICCNKKQELVGFVSPFLTNKISICTMTVRLAKCFSMWHTQKTAAGHKT